MRFQWLFLLFFLLIPLKMMAQQPNLEVRLAIDKLAPLFQDNKVVACSLYWKFSAYDPVANNYLDTAKLVLPFEKNLMLKLNSDPGIKVGLTVLAGDSVDDANNLTSVKTTFNLDLTPDKQGIRIPEDINGLKDINHYGAYQVIVTWKNRDSYTCSDTLKKQTVTVRFAPAADKIIGIRPGPNEVVIVYDTLKNFQGTEMEQKPHNVGLIKREITQSPFGFKAWVDENIIQSFKLGGLIAVVIAFLGLVGVLLFLIFMDVLSQIKFNATTLKQVDVAKIRQALNVFFNQPTIDNFKDVSKLVLNVEKASPLFQKMLYDSLMRSWRYKNHWSRNIQFHTYFDTRVINELESKKARHFNNRLLGWMSNILNLDYFWNISGVAPMLGLLGTVVGIAQAFGNIAGGTLADRGSLIPTLAGGINVALYTTIFGLLIGIPMMFAYYFIKWRLDAVSSLFVDFMNEIQFKFKANDADQSASSTPETRK